MIDRDKTFGLDRVFFSGRTYYLGKACTEEVRLLVGYARVAGSISTPVGDTLASLPVAVPADSRVLALFAKEPVAGRVKTRLARSTTAPFAAQVAAAFLGDLLDRLATLPFARTLVFDPPEAVAEMTARAAGRFALVPQTEGDLGQRLRHFIETQFQAGVERVVITGSDAPTIPLDSITLAFEALDTADLVLGPATDGGYYLLGCARRLPPIFEGITWGGSAVLAETIARLAEPSWRLALLPPWYDVDTLDDWQMLVGHLAAQRRAGIDPALPRTLALSEEWLGAASIRPAL